MGFGVVTFVITAIHFPLWPTLFPRLFTEEKWTVGREILFITANVLLIAVANRFYLESLLQAEGKSGFSWIGMILVTFLVGIFPITGLVLVSYIRRLKKYSQAAAELPALSSNPDDSRRPKIAPEKVASSVITLVAENEKDKLIISPGDLLFIESSDNYCTVFYWKNGELVKPLLRSSLGRLEKQIGLTHIVRCHRSYVVNLNRVERVTGNAQGYKLHLSGGQFQIPVARQYNETLIAELKAL